MCMSYIYWRKNLDPPEAQEIPTIDQKINGPHYIVIFNNLATFYNEKVMAIDQNESMTWSKSTYHQKITHGSH